MKLQRDTIYFLLLVNIIFSVGIAVLTGEENYKIVLNIFISILSGSVLSTIMSIVSYFNERNKINESIFSNVIKVYIEINLIRRILIISLDKDIDLINSISILISKNNIKEMSRIYKNEYLKNIPFYSFEYKEKSALVVKEFENVHYMISSINSCMLDINIEKNNLDILLINKYGSNRNIDIINTHDSEISEKYNLIYNKYCIFLQNLDNYIDYINNIVSEMFNYFPMERNWRKTKQILSENFISSLKTIEIA